MRHAVVLALVLAACHKDEKPAPAAEAPVKTPVAAMPAAAANMAKDISPSTDMTGLMAKLHYEATHRPGTGIKAEQVFAALDKAGLGLQKQRQFAGFTVKAAYCAGGTTLSGVPVSVCEYADDASAQAGKAYLDKELAVNGVRAVRGSTLINVGIAASPDIDKAVTAFNTL